MDREVLVCRSEDIKNDAVRIVEVDGVELGLIRHKGLCFAYRNVCPHQGGPACEGLRLPQVQDVIDPNGLYVGQRYDEDDVHIVCPWHGYEYHLATGVHVADEKLRLTKYPVSEREGKVYVTL
jgi:nitrite reductase/ring-hydroxylating ferredoxin subunit